MKKRLLSAALALAMVLTLLPVSVFAAPTDDTSTAEGLSNGLVDGTSTVTYYDRANSSLDGVDEAGWYFRYRASGATDDTYYYIGTGVVGTINQTQGSSGTWYKNYTSLLNPTGTALRSSSITLLSAFDITNLYHDLSVNLNGKALTFTNTISTDVKKLTFTDPTHTGSERGSVDLGDLGTINRAFELSMTNVTSTDGITATGNFTRRITLNNASIGALNLNGVEADNKQTAQYITATSSETGAITVVGNSSQVILKDSNTGATPDGIAITGTSASLQMNGKSTAGAVTLLGNGGTKEVSGNPPSVSIDKESQVTSIATIGGTAAEKANGTSTVTVYGKVDNGGIELKNANITVDGGTVADEIVITTGTVKVQGKGSNVEAVTLNGKATLDFTSATNATVSGAITAAADSTVKIPSEASNKYTSITGSYSKPCVNGGAWTTAPDAKYLNSTLQYALTTTATTYKTVYYTAGQLGEAITAQHLSTGSVLTPYNQVDTPGTVKITFKNGIETWGELTYKAASEITLPAEVAGVKTPTWFDSVDKKTYYGNGTYTTPSTAEAVELNAQGGGNAGIISKLTGAVVLDDYGNDLTASLVGNEIVVSGAVKPGFNTVKLRLTTDGLKSDGSTTDPKNVPITVDADLMYNSGTKTFTFAAGQASKFQALGMDLETTTNGLTNLVINKNTYTLKADLSERNMTIKVVGVDTDYTYPTRTPAENFIEVKVNVPRYNTDDQKKEIVNLLKGSTNNGTFKWAEDDAADGLSPAMKQAVNAALRSITDSNLTSWTDQAKRAAWAEKDRAPYTADHGNDTKYNTVLLVPFLQVNVSDYQPGKSITMTLVPSYRIEVVQGTVAADYKLNDNDGIYVVPGSTRALSLSGDLRSINSTSGESEGGISIKFPLTGFTGDIYAHQDGVYDYKAATGNVFMFTHAGSSNGLGTVTINNTAPQVKLYTAKPATGSQPTGTPIAYFTSLQAAVDEAKNGNFIVIDQNFPGNKTVNVTGDAREFYIQANGNTLVIANASGGLVDYNDAGSIHTVKLNRNTAPISGNITVAPATGGSASVNANPAKAGSTVTITLSANAGYTPNGVTVRTSGGQNVSVSGSGTTYTFTMPASGTVTVTPAFKTASTTATVSVSGNSYGTATTTAGNSQVAQGTPVTVSVAPYRGYRTMGLSVTGATATRTGVNQFTFTVPSGYTNVTVTPSFDVDNNTPFSDVWSNRYYSNPIAWAYTNGYTRGTTTYTYEPARKCTRAEMVAFLWQAAGSPTGNYSNPFSDVSANNWRWAYNAILWAAHQGLIEKNTGKFNPTSYITRADVVQILYKRAGSPNYGTRTGFNDVASNSKYARAVTWAHNKGITDGYGDPNRFAPAANITREEVATMLYRAFK